MMPADLCPDYCPGPDWRPREGGNCGGCGSPLTGRSWWFCPTVKGGNPCRDRYFLNHDWGKAREEAVRRSKRVCAHCGIKVPKPALKEDSLALERDTLEVNHKEPRNGQGYGMGCWNHQAKLETLCRSCHGKVSGAQATERARVARQVSA